MSTTYTDINKNTPIDFEVVTQKIKDSGLANVGKATIREVGKANQ